MEDRKEIKYNPRNTIKRTPGPGRPPIHGAYIILNTKDDPHPEVRGWLTMEKEAILEDLGGLENVTGKQQLMINNAMRVLNLLHHMDLHMGKEGVFVTPGQLQPLMSTYLAHVNSLSRILQSLGLEKIVKKGDASLKDVMNGIIEAKKCKKHEAG